MTGQDAHVAVVVPFTPGACADRDRAWEYVRARLEHFHPWPIIVGATEGRWSKGRAVENALALTGADVIVMHDADSFVSPDALEAAVAAVAPGVWAMPHQLVHRLNEASTAKLYHEGLAGDLTVGRHARLRYAYPGTPGGGIVALTRADYERCPIDPRFEGWGGEDDAWGRALCTLIGGEIRNNGPHGAIPPHRGTADLWHLYHPLAPTHRHRDGVLPETNALVARYKEATGSPRLMAALVADREAEPPAPLERPVTFRLSRQALRLAATKVRSGPDRLYRTNDPLLVEQLRAHRLAQEVL